jgi:hypothetical protein
MDSMEKPYAPDVLVKKMFPLPDAPLLSDGLEIRTSAGLACPPSEYVSVPLFWNVAGAVPAEYVAMLVVPLGAPMFSPKTVGELEKELMIVTFFVPTELQVVAVTVTVHCKATVPLDPAV